MESGHALFDAGDEQRLENSERFEHLQGARVHHRRPVPVQRLWIGIDDAALDPAAKKLRGQQQAGRARAHHENRRISNHVEPFRLSGSAPGP